MTTDIQTVLDHAARALKRSMTSYRGLARHEAFITAFSKQVQDIEDGIFGLIDGRALVTAVGQQLDGIGSIVGLSREGRTDDDYRTLIFVKIGQNTSQGGPEKVITIFNLLTGADNVHYMNLTGGSLMLATSLQVAVEDISFILSNMEQIAAGGVRIDHFVCYDAAEAFAFAGTNVAQPAAGWSDITGTQGGKFAVLKRNKLPFAFAGNTTSSRGWGSLKDAVTGGTFVGIGG